MNDSFNYYELLGISETATEKEIREAYKSQIKKWHPDVNHREESTFMTAKINEAREILLDKEKRRNYDEFLKEQRTETYKKHFRNNQTETNSDISQESYEEYHDMTKWDYLWEWLRVGKVSLFRKFIGLIGVFLESIFCTIINLLLLVLSMGIALGSWLLDVCSRILLWFISILFLVFIVCLFNEGFNALHYIDKNGIIIVLTTAVIFASSVFLSRLSDFIISEKVFTFLYQKININLFKICVGYNKES